MSITPSPTCTVKDGAGVAQATINGVNVTAGNTITIALASTAGVASWTISLYGKDELVSDPVLTINSVNQTATFTAPALGSALIFKSTVNNNFDINNVQQASFSTTFGIYVLTGAGIRVGASNETTEGNSSVGWISKYNPILRAGGIGFGSGFAPTELQFFSGDTSVGITTPTRLAERYFDISTYPATSGALNRVVKFKASFETTAGTAHCQLYNSTWGEVVVDSTTASLTTTETSNTLTVSNTANNLRTASNYMVRAHIIGGGALDHVTVTNARLEITYV